MFCEINIMSYNILKPLNVSREMLERERIQRVQILKFIRESMFPPPLALITLSALDLWTKISRSTPAQKMQLDGVKRRGYQNGEKITYFESGIIFAPI